LLKALTRIWSRGRRLRIELWADIKELEVMSRKERRRLASKRLYSHREAIRSAFRSLAEEGLIVPTGEMRGNPPRPVYVAREVAIAMGLVKGDLQ